MESDAPTPIKPHLQARGAVFVGVARNCASHLGGVLENLARFGAQYGRASYVFVVSDSEDETASVLAKWLADGQDGKLVDLGKLAPGLPLRTQRIAFARNACLDHVRERGEDNYDHLIVVDLDDVLGAPVSAEMFAKAAFWLDNKPERGGVFANGRPHYYDLWALRHRAWCPHDCWHQVQFPETGESTHIHDRMVREVYARMIAIPPWLPPIPVQSAFGGIGIYKEKFIRDARYIGLDEGGRETCEHVSFNTSVRQAGGTLHIFPALTVESPFEHSYEAQRLPPNMHSVMVRLRRIATVRWWLTCPFRTA